MSLRESLLVEALWEACSGRAGAVPPRLCALPGHGLGYGHILDVEHAGARCVAFLRVAQGSGSGQFRHAETGCY